MDKLKWCIQKKEGLRTIEPNSDLADAYIKKADEALESMRANIAKDWKISTAYYTIYFSLYALLIKAGIKCEIHACTIAFAKRFFSDFFDEKEIEFIEDSLRARIDSQYYVDRTVDDAQYEHMMRSSPAFLVKCKSLLIKLDEKRITDIHKHFKMVK